MILTLVLRFNGCLLDLTVQCMVLLYSPVQCMVSAIHASVTYGQYHTVLCNVW